MHRSSFVFIIRPGYCGGQGEEWEGPISAHVAIKLVLCSKAVAFVSSSHF